MPAKVKFRIMQHGNSNVVTIPKPYREYHNLTPGSEVLVLYDSLLLIVPKNMESLLRCKQHLVDQLLGQKMEENNGG